LATNLDALYERFLAFGPKLNGSFWKLYPELENHNLKTFPEPSSVHALCAPLRALIVYHRLAVKANWLTKTKLAINGLKRYLNRVVDAALKFQRQKDGDKTNTNLDLHVWQDVGHVGQPTLYRTLEFIQDNS
jgi:hypothetical protein